MELNKNWIDVVAREKIDEIGFVKKSVSVAVTFLPIPYLTVFPIPYLTDFEEGLTWVFFMCILAWLKRKDRRFV